MSFCHYWLQKTEASDDDEEGKALMLSPGSSSAKEEKENEAFFRKVTFLLMGVFFSHQFRLKSDLNIVKPSQMSASSSEIIIFEESPHF